MHKSTVYLTGAGPGDYKLISLRALELIKKADCIIYDYLVNPQLLKFADSKCKCIYVGKKDGAHTLSQEKINQLLVKQAKIHKTVVRLKGGDPFIFGRGAEEALHLKKKRIAFEIIPGITSAIAVPAYAGIPLTARMVNSTVGFITGHEDPTKKDSAIDWQALSNALGTMVFLMGVRNLPIIAKKLIDCGRSKATKVAIIMRGTTARQKTIVGNLGNIADLAKEKNVKPPAIIVVGEVAGLKKDLDWFEKKPLLGKRVIVTRTRKQVSQLSQQLFDLGADVIEVPTIRIVSLKADKQVKAAFAGSAYDWVYFSSQNGVEEFSEILDRLGKDSRIFGKAKIAAIGSETAKALKAIGIRVDYLPKQFVAETVLKHFSQKKFKAKRMLVLRAKQARNVLPQGLRKAGLSVDTIDLYDTCIEKESKPILKQGLAAGVDMVTFTSSSTVKNFMRLLGKDYRNLLKGIKMVSIGPSTSDTMREMGLTVAAQAKVHTIVGLVDAVIRLRNTKRKK